MNPTYSSDIRIQSGQGEPLSSKEVRCDEWVSWERGPPPGL